MPATALRAKLEAELLAMPPVAALGLRVAEVDATQCHLHAPLAQNLNDKGCAFGGSLCSVQTLAGWGLVNGWLGEQGLTADVYVAESSISYRVPVECDLLAEAVFSEPPDAAQLTMQLTRGEKCTFHVQVCVRNERGIAASRLKARFVAVPHPRLA